MAVIATTQKGNGAFTLNKSTLTASDTLAYVAGNGQYMEISNPTGGLLTATLVGAGASGAFVVPGTGGATINAAAGKAVPVAAGATVGVFLDTLSVYLVGAITVTGGTGLVATVLNN